MLKKLFKHTAIYGLAPQISKIAGIIALPVITKDLTDFDYGIWGVTLAYTGALEALRMVGMNVVLSNSFFRMPLQHKWLWRQIYGFLLLWSIPYTLLVAFLLWWVLPEQVGDNKMLYIALLVLSNGLFGPTSLLGGYYYQLRQRPAPIAIRTIIFGVLSVVLTVYTISYLKLGYMGWAWSFFIVGFLSNLSYWYPLNIKLKLKPILNFKWRLIKKSIKVGAPTIPHQYAGFLLDSSDKIVLDNLNVATGDLGKYSLASTFGGYFQAFINAANKAMTPLMLGFYKEKKDEKARDLVFILQGFTLAGTFLFCIWSKEIFKLLIKNETLQAVYPLAIIIVMAFNYRPMYIGAMNKLFYLEKTKLLWRVSLIAGLSNLLLNFILVPIFGFEAAAYSTFISLMYMGFSGFFIKKIREVQQAKFYPLVWLFLIILSTSLAYYLVAFSILIKLVTTFCLLGISASLFYYFKKRFI